MNDSAAVRLRRRGARNAARNSQNLADYAAAFAANPALFKGPPRPPTGYYDPTIDHQVSAGARGLGDLRIDVDTAKRRGKEDYDTGLGGLTQSRDRTLADLLTAETRLGQGQSQANRVQGITSAGLAAKQAAIRHGNFQLQRDRVGEDFTRQSGLLSTDYGRQFGDGGDLDLQLARGEREQPLLEADANELRLGQAKTAGWVPPSAAQQRALAIRAWKRKQKGL
jgi:hypothetical protein